MAKVAVLFTVLAIGAAARKKGVLNDQTTRTMANVVLTIALPFLYFHSLTTTFTKELFFTVWALPVFAVFFVLLAYSISVFLSRFLDLDKESKATFVYLATFTNCGFLAIPIANVLYGSEGIVRVVFFNVGFNLLYWTLGVGTLKAARRTQNSAIPRLPHTAILKNLLNGGTIGLLCGMAAGVASVKLPIFLLDASNILGSATIPLALLVVGSIMTGWNMNDIRRYRRSIALIALCRLVLIPSLALIITGSLGLPPLSRAIIVLQSAMPSASTTPIFTTKFGGNSQLASVGVFATTALSVLTIPVFLSLL